MALTQLIVFPSNYTYAECQLKDGAALSIITLNFILIYKNPKNPKKEVPESLYKIYTM